MQPGVSLEIITSRNRDAGDLAEDQVVFAKSAQRVAVRVEVIERDACERNVREVSAEGRTRELRHHFPFPRIRGDEVKLTFPCFGDLRAANEPTERHIRSPKLKGF